MRENVPSDVILTFNEKTLYLKDECFLSILVLFDPIFQPIMLENGSFSFYILMTSLPWKTMPKLCIAFLYV